MGWQGTLGDSLLTAVLTVLLMIIVVVYLVLRMEERAAQWVSTHPPGWDWKGFPLPPSPHTGNYMPNPFGGDYIPHPPIHPSPRPNFPGSVPVPLPPPPLYAGDNKVFGGQPFVPRKWDGVGIPPP